MRTLYFITFILDVFNIYRKSELGKTNEELPIQVLIIVSEEGIKRPVLHLTKLNIYMNLIY